MSRVGYKPIAIPDGVELKVEGNIFHVKGKLGKLSCEVPPEVGYTIEAGVLAFTRKGDRPQQRADHGLARALVNNMVVGVTEGYSKVLELQGVGYKWAVEGKSIALTLGYSHPVSVPVPEGIKVEIKGNLLTVSGIDKQLVGFVAASVRKCKKVEPYKGKGIRYKGEYVRRKAGKAGA